MRPRKFLGAHYKIVIIKCQIHIPVEGYFGFIIPLIDTWEPNMRQDPKKESVVVKELHMVEQNCFTYHTNSGDNSPYDKSCPFGIELQANSKTENHARCDKTPFTPNHVSHRKREKRAKESSSSENGYLSSKASTQMKSWCESK